MFGMLANFAHKSEMRESKDEILVGEIVRVMARKGWPAIAFRAHDDAQYVQFRTISDPMLHTLTIYLDRKTGQGMMTEAVFGSKATIRITAEVRNMLSDPDDLVKMYKTDLANLFKLGVLGGVKLNHELNSVFATTATYLEIDNYINKGENGVTKLSAFFDQHLGTMKEKLAPYKKS